MAIDWKFTGLLAAGAVATSVVVLVLTGDDGDGPADPASGEGPVPATSAAGTAPQAPGATGPAGAPPDAGGVPGGGPPPVLPLPAPGPRLTCPNATTTVSTPVELQEKLNDARPGEVIELAPGVYKGQYRTQRSGTADKPIWVCGPAQAVLDGGNADKGYGFHLEGASHWRLVGFTVRNSQKGVMLDASSGSIIQGLTVHDIGDEAIHLRRFSTGNAVTYNTITDTGKSNPRFGEGVYLGSSHKNWGRLTQGQPDKSDNNLVADNRIHGTTAEAVDIKEGTSGGRITGNVFDGSRLSGDKVNDSWVDVKGNNYLIDGNRGTRTVADGFQAHEEYRGWGTGNTFRGNVIDLGGGRGVGINLVSGGNRVTCDNRVTGGRLLNKGACS